MTVDCLVPEMSMGVYFRPSNFVRNGEILLYEQKMSREVLLYEEGVTSTICVLAERVPNKNERQLFFSVNGKVEADASLGGMIVQRMNGHLPMLFHPRPRKVVNIGLGATARSGRRL